MPKLPRKRLRYELDGRGAPCVVNDTGAHHCSSCERVFRFSDWTRACTGCGLRVHYHVNCGDWFDSTFLCLACARTD